ncbi:LysR family transcriptional regulator [Thioalkalivibrio sp.]|uniref:LysR family transcriptional regulator n=1 Tax=Thioalkalivibrio sp. TaxID=2093813 RepID=UPI003565DC99
MRVTLRQLQVFEAVARLGSFSRAAEEIHVTQPAVSKQIRQLQQEVGLPLLEQIGRQVCLTDAGRELLATCSDWLDTWNRFEQSIADLKGLKQGRLRIAVVTTAKYFMPRVLGPFCDRYPGIEVALEVINRNRLLERLGHNADDLYVMGVPPEGWEIESQPLLENNLVVVAPRTHRFVGRRRIPFTQLADETFIAREEGSGTRITVERVFAEKGIHFKVRMELGSNEAIKQAIAGGLGLAVLSQNTLGDPAAEELAVLDVTGFPVRRSWYLVWPRGKQLSVVAATFVDFLHRHVALLKPRA